MSAADEAMAELRRLLAKTPPSSEAGKVLRRCLPVIDGELERAAETRKRDDRSQRK